MNDATRQTRSSDIAALSQATDANGQVDLTAYQAYRLIYSHQSVDGLDAKGVVNAIVSSPVYATEQGREQVGSLVDAISSRLPPTDAKRFDEALDAANVNESWIERNYERYIEEPVVAGYETAKVKTGQALDWTDKQISDNLAAAKKWADEARENPQNSYLERAAGGIDSAAFGHAQNRYGAMKGATSHGLGMIGDTIDLAKFAHQFSNDRDFRNLVMGAAAVYANSAVEDPSKVGRDIKNAAVGAWNEWEAGYEKAVKEGKEREYVGGIEGAAAIEIIATFVPATKLTNLAKVAKAADVAEDLAPAAGKIAGRVEAHAGIELASELVELAHDAQKLQAKGGAAAEGADLMFQGLAGVKRSQGELGDLVEGFRKSGNLDGLLQSGALSPKELGHLARKDISMFEGQVSMEKAVDAYIGKRKLSELTDPEVGDIGEAFVSHDLAKKGYTDLVAIQNKQGHGIDVVGKNSEGQWESFEVKASVQGTARKQFGNPEEFITDRLEKAKAQQGSWAPKNMWEEEAQATAAKILDETTDLTTGKVDIESKWARVNIERDPATGVIKGEPEIEKWKTPLERQQDRQLERSLRQEGQKTPVDADHQDFGLHQQIKGKVTELDHQNGRSFDDTSARMTASLLTLAKDNGLTRVDHVVLSNRTDSLTAAQNIFVVQGSLNDPAMLRAHMPTVQAAQTPVEQSFNQLEQVNQRLAQQQAQQQTLDQNQAQSQGSPSMRMA
ncbi:XVIPCD domain-containing protein [Xanthomonas axonopodis]